MTIPSASSLQNPTEITLEAWVYPAGASGNPQTFISKGDGISGTSSRAYEMVLFSNGGNTGPGSRIEVNFFVGADTWAGVGAPVPFEKWIHVAATYRSSDGLQTLYTNGVLAAAKTTSGGTTGSSVAGKQLRQISNPILFGKLENPLNNYANGAMDEVRIWSKARTAEEINNSQSCTLSGTETNLEAYWSFDSGAVTDLTGHGHDGVMGDLFSSSSSELCSPRFRGEFRRYMTSGGG